MAIHSLVGFDELNLDESPAEHKLDFDSWTILISNVEKKYSDDINKLSLVYDSFLSEFPLCCGYWIKYAAHRARLCCVEEVIRVYEKAVESASFSVDLWVDYCSFAISVFEDPFDVCRLFRRGLSFIGKDYLCHALWDKYIDFEFSQKHWTSLSQIYIEVLKFPTKKLHQYYESFKKLVTIWGEETGCHGDSIVKLQPETGIGGEFTAPAIDEVSFVIKDLLEPSTRFEALKNYISIGAHLYLKASELDLKILGFEKNMLRTYFDMKPLDDDQLENWHHYLDFVEMNGDFEWAVKLYERCLIPCASYSEFWMRYVEYAESKGGREIANDALERATRLFLKDLPAIHLFNAGLKEQIGDISGAHSAFLHFDMHSKSSFIDYAMRRANMEKRLGNNIAACNVYREALAVATKEMPNSLPMLYIQFSRLQYMVSNCVDAARDILIDGIQNMASCKLLWEELINLALNHEAARQINILDPIFANAIMPGTDVSRSLSYKDRLDISELYMKFIDLCGNIYESRRAWNRHIKLFPHTLRAYSKRTESVRAFSREKILTDGADGTAVNKKEVTRTDEMNPMIQLSADDAENFKDVPDEDDTCRSDEGNKKVLCAAAYIDPTENDNSNNICHIQKEELHVSGRDERPLLDVLSLNEPVNEPHNLASSVDHGCPSHREASRSNSMLEFEQSIKPHPGSSLPNAKFNNSGQGYCECPTNASTPSLWSPQCSEDHKDLESSHRSSKRQDSIKYSGERNHKKWSVSPPRCGSPQPSDSFLDSLSCRSPWSSVERQGEEHSHSPPRQHFSLDGSRGLQSYLRHRQNRPMYNNYSGGRRVQNERRGPSSYTRRGRHVLNQRSTHTSQLQPPGQAGGYLSGHTVDYSLQSNEQHPNMQSDQACNQMLQYCYYQQQLMHLQQQSYPNLPQQPVQPPQQLRQPHPQLQSQQQLQSQANQMQLLQFQYQQMQLQYQMQQPQQEASKQAQAHGDEHDESQTQHSQLHGDVQTQQQQQQQLYQQMQIQQQPEQLHPAGDAQQQQHQMQLQQQMQAYQYQQQYILYLQQWQQQQQLFPAGKENQNGLNLQWEQQLPQTPCEQQDGDQENEGASSQMKS